MNDVNIIYNCAGCKKEIRNIVTNCVFCDAINCKRCRTCYFQKCCKPPGQVVYFLQESFEKLIKIGFSKNLGNRIDMFESILPQEIKLIGYMAGGYNEEFKLKEQFTCYKHKREWFNPAKEILDFIKKVDIKDQIKTKTYEPKIEKSAMPIFVTHEQYCKIIASKVITEKDMYENYGLYKSKKEEQADFELEVTSTCKKCNRVRVLTRENFNTVCECSTNFFEK